MPSLSQIRVPARDIVVPFDDDIVVNVTYRPLMWSPQEISILQENRDINTISEMSAKLIVKWDLTDENGDVLPTDFETLKTIPLPIQAAILAATNKDQTP